MLIDKATSIIHLIVNNNKQVLKANIPAGCQLILSSPIESPGLPSPPTLQSCSVHTFFELCSDISEYVNSFKLSDIVFFFGGLKKKNKIGEAKDTHGHTKRVMYYRLLSGGSLELVGLNRRKWKKI